MKIQLPSNKTNIKEICKNDAILNIFCYKMWLFVIKYFTFVNM